MMGFGRIGDVGPFERVIFSQTFFSLGFFSQHCSRYDIFAISAAKRG